MLVLSFIVAATLPFAFAAPKPISGLLQLVDGSDSWDALNSGGLYNKHFTAPGASLPPNQIFTLKPVSGATNKYTASTAAGACKYRPALAGTLPGDGNFHYPPEAKQLYCSTSSVANSTTAYFSVKSSGTNVYTIGTDLGGVVLGGGDGSKAPTDTFYIIAVKPANGGDSLKLITSA